MPDNNFYKAQYNIIKYIHGLQQRLSFIQVEEAVPDSEGYGFPILYLLSHYDKCLKELFQSTREKRKYLKLFWKEFPVKSF